MTPKEKAEELWREVFEEVGLNQTDSIECAIITVDKLITSFGDIFDDFISNTQNYGGYRNMRIYWQDVKKELEETINDNG